MGHLFFPHPPLARPDHLHPGHRSSSSAPHRHLGAHRRQDRAATPSVPPRHNPIVQILAQLPPPAAVPVLAVWAFIETGVSVINIGGILLMSLGAQWYILFNVHRRRPSHPHRLEKKPPTWTASPTSTGWQRWKRLTLPAVFPSLRHRRHHRFRRRLERLHRRRNRHPTAAPPSPPPDSAPTSSPRLPRATGRGSCSA